MNTEYVVQVDDDGSIGRHSNHNHHRKMAPQIALYCNTNTNIANRTRYMLSQWQSLSPSQSYSLLLSIVLPNSVSSLMRRLLLMRAIIKRFLWVACCIRRFPIFPPPLYLWLSHAPASAATLPEWPQLVLTLRLTTSRCPVKVHSKKRRGTSFPLSKSQRGSQKEV